MESTRINQIYDLVDLLAGRKAIGNKWVLKIKRKTDGSIKRYKACPVAKGYTRERIYYEKTLPSGEICLNSHDFDIGRLHGFGTCPNEH